MTPEQKNQIVATVACEHCGAAPGELCRMPNGQTLRGQPLIHLARRDAAFAAGVYVAR